MIASIHASFTGSHRRRGATNRKASARDESRRNALIVEHLPMVPKIVAKTVGRTACRRDMDEYISAGRLGLVQAAQTFDPAVGENFGVYAYGRIRGAVLDEIRKSCFLPASAYRRLRRVNRAKEDLTCRLDRPPNEKELTEELRRRGEDAREAMRILHGAQYLAGDDMDVLPLIPGHAAGPDETAQSREDAQRLAEAIKRLPHQHRVVLHLYYHRNQKMKTIGRRLGLTESRISQVLTRAVELLRQMMKETPSQPAAAA
ncbi:MAG: sigma-70 family RNA polymerase sigma factor [Phycisphaerae bacterium]|nr:sigma-70 family RNA polymerase sigma factor [Phycisphaerae bacterium]